MNYIQINYLTEMTPIRQISKKSLIVLTHLISSYYHTAHKNMEHLIIASTMVKI